MIYLLATLGLISYYIYQMYMYKGNIVCYISDKKNLLHFAFSAVTMVILLITIDWSAFEKTTSMINLNFNYAYLIAVVIGWSNGSIFMAVMKAMSKNKEK